MNETRYINASCGISGNRQMVIKNSQTIFQVPASLPVQEFLKEVYGFTGAAYPKFYKMDGLCKLGWLAAEILLVNSFDKTVYLPENIGLVLSNRNSSLDNDIKYYDSVKTIASPALFVYTLPNIVMGEICIRHQFKGENDFFIFDRFNPGFIQQYVNHLFDTEALDACICGWVDLLDNDCLACLFLVERTTKGDGTAFTEDNMNQFYKIIS